MDQLISKTGMKLKIQEVLSLKSQSSSAMFETTNLNPYDNPKIDQIIYYCEELPNKVNKDLNTLFPPHPQKKCGFFITFKVHRDILTDLVSLTIENKQLAHQHH